MDLVSVIIPYYNKKKFINKTINSAINQTYKHIEILIVYDDENIDDLKFINEIKKKDKRIVVIQNKKKKGAGTSRNVGISKSNGKYIAFLDADDIWETNKLEKQIKFMDTNNLDISHTSYYVVDEKKNILGKRFAKNFFLLNELLKSCDIGLSTVIIKKDLINDEIKFPALKTKEDFVLWLQLLRNGKKIYALNEYLTFWTKSKHSLSSSTYQKILDGFRVYHKYMKFNFFKSLYFLFCLSINFILKK